MRSRSLLLSMIVLAAALFVACGGGNGGSGNASGERSPDVPQAAEPSPQAVEPRDEPATAAPQPVPPAQLSDEERVVAAATAARAAGIETQGRDHSSR